MIKHLYKAAAAVFVTAVLLPLTAVSACTGIYIGKDISADGSTMLARTEDVESANNKMYVVHEAKDHAAGEIYTDEKGFSIPYPAHTLRYTAVCDSPERGLGESPFGEAGFNEFGVAATSTITAYPNDKALKADPFIENGLFEMSANDIILSRARTAREGIEVIASIIDKYGSGEGNIIMTADKAEAWYMEILSGHQYAAVKMPSDMAAAIPNNYMLETIDPSSPDVIVSKDLITLPKSKGFLQEENGSINIKKTYSIDMKESSIVRVWGAQKFLSSTVKGSPTADTYSLFFKPDHKISLEEVFEVQKYRYEDTGYSADIAGNEDIRVIGTSRQQECHVLQIRHDMPADIAGIEWLCMGNAEFSVFLPSYAGLLTDTADIYKVTELKYNEHSAYWAFRGLSALCAFDRIRFGRGVRQYWTEYQRLLINKTADMDTSLMALKEDYPESLSEAANAYAAMTAKDAFSKSKYLRNGLMTFMAAFEGKKEAGDDLTGLEYIPDAGAELILPLFVDLDSDKWYFKYIDYCVNKGYMQGTDHGRFDPEENMTRSQYLALIYRLFYDDAKNWLEAGDYVMNLIGKQWTGDERHRTVTRGEVADICCKMLKAHGKELNMVNDRKTFSDMDGIDNEMAEGIQYLQMAGVIDGYGNGMFGPNDPLRRADMTAIIYNLSNIID